MEILEWSLIVIGVIVFGIASIRAPRLMTRIIVVGGFLLIVAWSTYYQGLSGLIIGLIMGAVFAALSWLGLNKANKDAEKARAWLLARASRIKYPIVCERCGVKLPYVRIPKSFRQLMWGGWTCPGCGAELDYAGKEIDTRL